MLKQHFFKLSKQKQDYYACVILHLILPLLPIGLEFISRGSISAESLTLMASFYAISISLSSKSPFQFALGIMICIIFSSIFGMIANPNHLPPEWIRYFAGGTIAMIFVFHAMERYDRHVIDCEKFWDWFDYEEREQHHG